MTMRERVSVVAVIIVGLVPAYGVYQYVEKHPVLEVSSDWSQSAALGAIPSSGAAEVYQSQPVKEIDGLCKNSYYASFVLSLARDGSFSLMKRCESARDTSMMWYGTIDRAASTTAQIFTIVRDTEGPLEESVNFSLSEEEGELFVVDTTLTELATTTRFLRVPSASAERASDARVAD